MTNAYASAAFTGTEPPPEHLRFDPEALRAWVGGRLEGFDGPLQIMKFKGGQSNPTYRVDAGGRAYVLRRKPPGPLQPTAHAIDREFRVLTALVGAGVPIPHPHLYCDDPGVIGSAFYIVDAVDGPVYWSAELPGMTPEFRRAYYTDLVQTLAKIDSVDWKATGLENFGRPTQYTQRNLERWYKIFCDTKPTDVPEMDWSAAALRERLPKSEPVCLIHGDFGVHNTIAVPGAPRVAAVLDWEVSTIGNPLTDLAHFMRPWMEPRSRAPAGLRWPTRIWPPSESRRSKRPSRPTPRPAAWNGRTASSTWPSPCSAMRP